MARSRNIKPGFFTNPELVELPYETRLLFAGLWTVADRKGRLQDRPKKIKMEVFPADTVEIDTMLDQLHKAGFICRYVVGEEKLILINNWAKHQAPHHTEKRSVLPPAPHEVETDITPCVNGYDTEYPPEDLRGNPPDSLIPDSGFTDSLIRSPVCGDPSPGKPEPAAPRGSRLDPDWVLPKAWGLWSLAEFKHWTEDAVRSESAKFKDHWLSESGAKARKADWLATWRKWCRSDIAQRAHPPPGQGTETNYTRQMRERVEEATGSMAHIVAAKAPGTPKQAPWDIAIENNARTAALGMGRSGDIEADGQVRPRLSEPV